MPASLRVPLLVLTAVCLVTGCASPPGADDARRHPTAQAAMHVPAPEQQPVRVAVPADAPGPSPAGVVTALPPPPAPVRRAPARAPEDDARSAPREASRSQVRQPAPQGSAPRAAAAPRTAAPAPAAPRSGSSSLAAAVNAERTGRGLAALAPSSCAQRYAERWAARLASTGTLAHQDLGPVLSACGASAVGENVARSGGSASQTVALWMDSAGHRANILDGGFSHSGVASVRASDGQVFSVQVFLSL